MAARTSAILAGAASGGRRLREDQARSAQGFANAFTDLLWRAIREDLTRQHERLTQMAASSDDFAKDPDGYAAWKLAESILDDVALDVLNIFRVAKGLEALELPDGQLVSWQRAATVEEAR